MAHVAVDDPVMGQLAGDGLLVGLAAWTQPALVGHLYPPRVTSAEERLRFYAKQFPITEVDATFYRPLAERTATLWVTRTPAGFTFDVKAFRLLTHHPTPRSVLWRDVRENLPPEAAEKPTIYARDLPSELLTEVLARFRAALSPLRDSGRLGLVLFQLPRYVFPSRASLGYLEWVAGELVGTRVAIEFRQRRWMDDEHRDSTVAFLAEHGLVYVCVDEPPGLASTVPPLAVATADVAEVKFHGRNATLWEVPDVPPIERHRYDYPRAELAEWVPKILQLHDGGRPVQWS